MTRQAEERQRKRRNPDEVLRDSGTEGRTRKLGTMAQSHGRRRVTGGDGDGFPDHAHAEQRPPRPPAICIIYPGLFDDAEEPSNAPEAVYGQYPRGLIKRALPHLRCERRDILHVCSGSLPKGEGTRVDIRREACPDILADGRALPFLDNSWSGAIMLDPPYTKAYAKGLYGINYPRPSELLREAARVIRPGGRIAILHYITPQTPEGCTFIKVRAVGTGFDMPIRALTFYEKDGRQEGLRL